MACRYSGTGEVVCHLRGAAPEAGLGTSMQDIAGDADDTLDQGLPFGVGHRAGRAEYVNRPGLMAIARGGDRGVAAGGVLRGADDFGILHQSGLIVLQLDNRLRLGLRGSLEGFFWQCNASRVMVVRATSSSPSNCCAAGISLDFSSMSICARTRPALVSNACSNWTALRSVKLSKLRLSTLPSSATVRCETPGAPSSRPAAWRRNACSTAFGSSPWRM